MEQADWVHSLKLRLKRNRRLATALFYLTDLLYLNDAEKRRFLASFSRGARRVNLGAGFRSSPPGFLALDRGGFPGSDVVADIRALPFLDASLDGILCEVVLEHVPDVLPALAEIERVLRPGGRVYLTLPFIWPYHASPHDYRRWTVSGVAHELRGFESIAQGLAGGPTTALVNVLHEWLAIVLSFNLDALYRVLYLVLMPVLFPFKLLDRLFANFRHANKIAALFYLHGRKRSLASRGRSAPPS